MTCDGRRAAICRRGFGVLLFALLVLEDAITWADVPVNGRTQNMAFTREQVQAISAAAYDQSLQEFARQGKLDQNPRLLARVRKIAARLITQAVDVKPGAARWNWEVHVAGADGLDAYCMAGGKILVGAAFLEGQQFTDSELAALLAHEIAHAIAEHVREELSTVRQLSPAYGHFSLEEVTGILDWDLSVSFKLLPLSRLHELEADDIGIYLAAKAGFNPQALARFYRKLGRLDGGPAFFDTHGPSDQRMRAVEAFAAYAEPLYQASLAGRPASEFAFH